MENTFPKYQISKFHNGNRNIQSVFRTNDVDEYNQQMTEWAENDAVVPVKTPVIQKAYSGGFQRQQAGETCNKCEEGKIVLNPKTGKTFCDQKCWLKP